jgi:transcriptional regulator with XRE-family HTH domain
MIGERLRELRLALGYENASDFARHVKVTVQALSNWETGYRRINVDDAHKISEKIGVPLDYIYNGHQRFLDKQFADKIEHLRTAKPRAWRRAPLNLPG